MFMDGICHIVTHYVSQCQDSGMARDGARIHADDLAILADQHALVAFVSLTCAMMRFTPCKASLEQGKVVRL
jgi:hypothetical protein